MPQNLWNLVAFVETSLDPRGGSKLVEMLGNPPQTVTSKPYMQVPRLYTLNRTSSSLNAKPQPNPKILDHDRTRRQVNVAAVAQE